MRVHTLCVGMLQTNCHIVFDLDQGIAACIDPGGNAEEILAFLKEHNLTLQDIYLTHSHFDHILAAAPLRDATGARVVVHAQEEEGLLSASSSLYLSIASEPYRACPPDIRIYGGEKTMLGETEVYFMHTPGHSPGSVCIRIENLLFTGDTLFEGTCGRWDLRGGNLLALRSSLRYLYNLSEDYIVYPGHGRPTILSIEKASNEAMLSAINV